MRPDHPALRSRPGGGRCNLVGHGFALPSGGRAAIATGHRDGCPRKPAVDPACRPNAVVVRVARLAHAMTSHADGRSDGHGPLFMGVYLQLIVRYLRLDPRILIDSLRDAGIEITRDARPVFVDP
jgi:hypothetical protein